MAYVGKDDKTDTKAIEMSKPLVGKGFGLESHSLVSNFLSCRQEVQIKNDINNNEDNVFKTIRAIC